MSADTDVLAVEAANASLYDAFERADVDAMARVWVDGDLASRAWCVHPGSGPVVGRDDVLRSWTLLMANTAYIQFVLTSVLVMVDGDHAVVTCMENILTSQTDDGDLGGGAAVATNLFVRTDGRWRLWLHHASPILTAEGGSP
ncbi:MAG: nuclear transport factor 2 family protein [Actinomycetes bacterium]